MTIDRDAVIEALRRVGLGRIENLAVVARTIAEALNSDQAAPEPQLPAEPPNGCVVRLWDGEHDRGVVQRIDWPDDSRGRWYRMGLVGALLWPKLAKPGWRVERLLPESQAFPRELAERLAHELRLLNPGMCHEYCSVATGKHTDVCSQQTALLAAAQGKLGAVTE